MRVDQFDFELPEDLIALRPVSPRDAARLLVVRPARTEPARFCDMEIGDLPSLLDPGDLLVFNRSRVLPARLHGVRCARGTEVPVDATLHKRLSADTWRAFARPAKRLRIGDTICFAGDLNAEVTVKEDGGEVTLRFDQSGTGLDDAVRKNGVMPLPPYISRRRRPDERDRTDYQTVFAETEGSVAAPTAGLHFSNQLLRKLEDRGIGRIGVTLHVGAGTFLPVKVEDTRDHRMHTEWGEVSDEAASRINDVRRSGGRVVAIGTTALRVIESAADDNGAIVPWSGDTGIFITPGYRFRVTDALVTNFHLPRSTLFMLVCAFSGTETMKAAYAHAVDRRYRFYSYGDACLLFQDSA